MEKIGYYFLRYSLAASFLSAVADRFGLWGKAGTSGVVWGNFENFTSYTGSLLSFLPSSSYSFFSWSATILEIIIAVFLIVGFRLKYTAMASSLLLASFAFSMTISYGFKSPLDYSVLTACAASWLLANHPLNSKRK